MGLAASIAALALTACQPPAQPLTPEQSAKLSPRNPRLAQLYDNSCKACHTVADTRAPLTGDRTQWDPRWAKGEEVLVTNSQVGFGNMPANGQCFECSPEDLGALIKFMAGREP